MTNSGVHPFEAAGLGKAPFRFVAVETRRGPMVISEAGGVTVTVGAPGQPMGVCDFCGTGIAECCIIKSADGRQFIVGNECVRRTGDDALVRPIEREVARKRTEARRARDDAAIEEAWAALERVDVRAVLDGEPHPHEGLAANGLTRLAWVCWMLERAGRTGKVKAARAVLRAAESLRQS